MLHGIALQGVRIEIDQHLLVEIGPERHHDTGEDKSFLPGLAAMGNRRDTLLPELVEQCDKLVLVLRYLTDAMVDIGSMRQIDDALEVVIRWPYMPASFGPEPVEKDALPVRHTVRFRSWLKKALFLRRDTMLLRRPTIRKASAKRQNSLLLNWPKAATDSHHMDLIPGVLLVGQLPASVPEKILPGRHHLIERRWNTRRKRER